MSLCNTSGPIGDDHRLYRLPGQFQQGQCVDWACFINGRGGITSWGSNSNGQNGLNQGSYSIWCWYGIPIPRLV